MLAANAPVTSDLVVYLPGIMGSELVDGKGNIVWGMKPSLIFRQAVFGDVLSRLAVRPDDDIRASRPLVFPVSLPFLSAVEPYTALAARLRTLVMHDDGLVPFAYDWRRSIADAAKRLAPLLRVRLAAWRERWKTLTDDRKAGLPEPRVTLVGHSMGGLVARYFTAFCEGGDEVRRIVTLGTPFAGSLNAVDVLATGKNFPLGVFADALRNTVRTMPGVYELVARWKCVAGADSHRHITSADMEGVGADGALADAATATMNQLDAALSGGGSPKPDIRCLVGTTQPTLQTVTFQLGSASFTEAIDGTDWRGDGTVFRYAAVPTGVQPMYLPQAHGALAKTNEAVEFVAAVLTERSLGDFLAPAGIGLRAPPLVAPQRPFTIEVLDGAPGMLCQLHDAEDNRLITVAQVQSRDGALVANFSVPGPGLYRVLASGGGFSAVEQLVGAVG